METMAEAMVGAALETLSSLIQEELSLYLGVEAEMRRLSSLLTTIKAVLEDAEEKQIKDKVIKNWLRKLRDEAHLLDDILDECSTYALSLEYKNKVPCSCFYSFKPSHVMFRYKMANKLKDISQRLGEIAEERSKFHLRERVHEERRTGVMEWRETSSNISQSHFYGRDTEKQNIVDFFVGDASNSEDLSVYPIVGIGGLGKTTLAQQVYHDERVIDHFEPKLWVCVSDDFSPTRLLKAIIESAGHTCRCSSLEPLQTQVKQLLGRKRYLLVLDDVWNDDQGQWDRLKSVLACGSKGASILVTTRLAKVAHITGTMDPLHLSLLSEDDCWELFKQRAFGPPNEERAELVDIGKEIVKKCKGVPLAAKTLGSLLRFHSDEKYWIKIKENEIWNLPEEEQEKESIMSALRLSYLNLSAKSRQCFAYLAVFPKDEEMSKKQVIELWMANGFISTSEGRDAEDNGDRVWNELCSKSFFEDAGAGGWWSQYHGHTMFKIHDLFHDLAQVVMEEECCSKTFESSPPGERTRHLSIYGGGQFDEQWSSHFSRLKLLKSCIIIWNIFNHKAITSDVVLKCYSLRALDLMQLKEVPSSIDQLKHLRYLNLYRGDFSRLPDSICRLWNLLILNLNNCRFLQELPDQLKCLKSLRHLHLEGCESLSRLAPEMGKLTCLKTLVTYIVGMEKGFFLEEIGNLKLEGTLHIKHLERVTSEMDAKKANLADKRLNKLELSWEREEPSQLQQNEEEMELSWEREEPSQLQQNEEEILKVLQPHTQLKTLVMVGYHGAQLPQWMGNTMLKDLSCLELKDCRNVVHISFVAKLSSLKHLSLWKMDEVQCIDDECYADGVERGFQALEYLTLSRLPGLVKLSMEDGGNMFPRLSELKIDNCPQLNLSREDGGNMFPRLLALQIDKCPQLNLPFLPSVTTLAVVRGLSRVLLGSIQNLPNLESLIIQSDEELTSFPDDMLGGLKNLKTLNIGWLPKLEALPAGLSNLNALEELSIVNCDSLETITEEILRVLRSLKEFTICGIPKFKLGAGFRYLVALEDLGIENCPEVEDMHDALQHLTNLQNLALSILPNLASLPHWLGNLSSLEVLQISLCPKLTSLPMSIQSLTNLRLLRISGCPELGKRCKDETGEDWHKISHVRVRDISDE